MKSCYLSFTLTPGATYIDDREGLEFDVSNDIGAIQVLKTCNSVRHLLCYVKKFR
jgi:hypothetical protein